MLESPGSDYAGSEGACFESEEEAAVAAANEGNIDIGYITNLASDDIMNIREFIWNIHYIWALPLKVHSYNSLFDFHTKTNRRHGAQSYAPEEVF